MSGPSLASAGPLRLLASTNNARGDLFTRLVKDLFFALGYDDLRLNVHKTGREIDIQGTHRFEPRRLVAECKAQADKIGGDELDKFLGVVTRERDRDETTSVASYFVSLSGFRESGKELEVETSKQRRNVLLDGARVVEELVRARILINRDTATEQAGRCAERAGLQAAELEGAELLGHELGYLWAVFYAHGKERTHFALIYADGTPLAETSAREVIQADRKGKGNLYKLQYLAPPAFALDRQAVARGAVERYRQWVSEECGHIQLDGLPADSDLSAMRMKLERLFVPLRVVSASGVQLKAKKDLERDKQREVVTSVGEFLEKNSRFSLLAKPGGGKSTLLKRLAIAYAVPERRSATDDGLPECDWLPLFLRCRELRDRAHRPIRELLHDISQYAGMNGGEASVFCDQIDEALRAGQVLLLIDGLDEISDEGARTTFVGHLRTFLAMFPGVAMVVTSREAGFRQIAGVIASACQQAQLAPFGEKDVRRLCESWHVEVVGNTDKVRAEARDLAATIWDNERIRALAENPLMLTTLLVVRRSIGELPTRRVELYREAVKVLVRTWNTEGFTPMDLDEALAQLSYVACTMMNEGIQQVGHRRLLKLLQQARGELQAELQFTRTSPAEFIERIEYRSSLLMQTGHEWIEGELEPVYEFRHLTFQEYLAARGLVAEQYPGRDGGQTLVEFLEPHFEDESWREIIPLAAVLAGRKADPLVQRLALSCEKGRLNSLIVLRQCLRDEVQVTLPTLRAGLLQAARCPNDVIHSENSLLIRGKFGELFQEIVEEAYIMQGDGWEEYALAMSALAEFRLFSRGLVPKVAAEQLAVLLTSEDRREQIYSALGCMLLAYERQFGDRFHPLRDVLGDLLPLNKPSLALASAWALAWIGTNRQVRFPPKPHVLVSLYWLSCKAEASELRRYAAWAFSSQPLLPRDTFSPEAWGNFAVSPDEHAEYSIVSLVLAWYKRTGDAELIEGFRKKNPILTCKETAIEILSMLGEPANKVLEKWKRY